MIQVDMSVKADHNVRVVAAKLGLKKAQAINLILENNGDEL